MKSSLAIKRNELLKMQQLGWLSRVLCWEKKPVSKCHIPHDFIYITFSKLQRWRTDERSPGLREGAGGREEDGCYCRGPAPGRSLRWRRSPVSWLWWWLQESTCVKKLHRSIHTHTYTNVCMLNWEIWMCSGGCTNVSFLVLLLYYGYMSIPHGENWVKSTGDLFTVFATSYKAITSSRLKGF